MSSESEETEAGSKRGRNEKKLHRTPASRHSNVWAVSWIGVSPSPSAANPLAKPEGQNILAAKPVEVYRYTVPELQRQRCPSS